MEEIRTDVLVAGGGMAGLMAAWRAQRAGAGVVLLTGAAGASVQMAGFSTALGDAPDDRPADLFNDMFLAGGFLNHPALLAAIVSGIGPETRALEEIGVPFQRANGKLARRQAAGVSRPGRFSAETWWVRPRRNCCSSSYTPPVSQSASSREDSCSGFQCRRARWAVGSSTSEKPETGSA